MPYCGKEKEEQIKKDVEKVVTVGDMNLAYTVHIIIPMWIKEQQYKTIHAIRAVLSGKTNDQVCRMIDYQLRHKGFTQTDVETARSNAYDEFWRRVGQFYEDECIRKNGDVYKDVPYASTTPRDMEQGKATVPVSVPLVKRAKRSSGGKKLKQIENNKQFLNDWENERQEIGGN